MRRIAFGALALSLVASVLAQDAKDAKAHAAITAERFKRTVDVLASDELAGRLAGSEGGHKAAEWLAARLTALGLEPGGDEGTYFQNFDVEGWKGTRHMRNVIATLPARKGSRHADETIVVGSHYDHLGHGGNTELDPISGADRIHPGADDNASGCAGTLEVARGFAAAGPAERRLVFIFFDGEEPGYYGSTEYTRHPKFPIDKTVLMLNMDMIGRAREKLVLSYASGVGFEDLEKKAIAGLDLVLDTRNATMWNSDHEHFASLGVPYLYLFTGLHDDYHRVTDTADKIDSVAGANIARFAYSFARLVADADERATARNVMDVPGDSEVMEQEYALMAKEWDPYRHELFGFDVRSYVDPSDPADVTSDSSATPGFVGKLSGQSGTGGASSEGTRSDDPLPIGAWAVEGSGAQGAYRGVANLAGGAAETVHGPLHFTITFIVQGRDGHVGFEGALVGNRLLGTLVELPAEAGPDSAVRTRVTYLVSRSGATTTLTRQGGVVETLTHTAD